ncbi:hypothetical protein BDQ17DRAFT_1414942 [Cyathus striatus]|nr:hypothetical protein BDQ17DRAFT_1414942 [Cyathus striatus]
MPSGRVTRSSRTSSNGKEKPQPSTAASKTRTRQTKNASKNKRKRDDSESEPEIVDEYDEEEEAEERVYDSDALDESDDEVKRKTKAKAKTTKRSPKKRSRKTQDDEEDEEDGLDLKEGQVVVGKVVQAPKTGQVPPGQISKNTFEFLRRLKDPNCNDREWFKLHEPVYRQAEKEFKDFVEVITDLLVEADSQIPHLPPKDVIHRIYRDIRFSNDKTPYKTGFSASFSRSGRKGIFAGFKPGNESLIAAGLWCPGKNELATIRTNLQQPNGSRRLRQVISHPDFVKFFGTAKPHPKGARQNIFGMEDELKVAPKGVDKGHKDIDLLKLRSFAVVHRFMDSEVLSPDFKNSLVDVARIVTPFVHCLNDLVTVGYVPPATGGDEDDEDEDEGEGEGEGEDGGMGKMRSDLRELDGDP